LKDAGDHLKQIEESHSVEKKNLLDELRAAAERLKQVEYNVEGYFEMCYLKFPVRPFTNLVHQEWILS